MRQKKVKEKNSKNDLNQTNLTGFCPNQANLAGFFLLLKPIVTKPHINFRVSLAKGCRFVTVVSF